MQGLKTRDWSFKQGPAPTFSGAQEEQCNSRGSVRYFFFFLLDNSNCSSFSRRAVAQKYWSFPKWAHFWCVGVQRIVATGISAVAFNMLGLTDSSHHEIKLPGKQPSGTEGFRLGTRILNEEKVNGRHRRDEEWHSQWVRCESYLSLTNTNIEGE